MKGWWTLQLLLLDTLQLFTEQALTGKHLLLTRGREHCGGFSVPQISITDIPRSLPQSRTSLDVERANSLWTKWNQLLQGVRFSIRTRRAHPKPSTSLQISNAPYFKQHKVISMFLVAIRRNSRFSPKRPKPPKWMTNAVLTTAHCKEEKRNLS